MFFNSRVWAELRKYVQNAKKWELPKLRKQCEMMIKFIDERNKK